MSLTAIAIKNARPQAKPYKLTDERALFLLVMPNGAKYWRMQYRHLGKQKTLSLGVRSRTAGSLRRNDGDLELIDGNQGFNARHHHRQDEGDRASRLDKAHRDGDRDRMDLVDGTQLLGGVAKMEFDGAAGDAERRAGFYYRPA